MTVQAINSLIFHIPAIALTLSPPSLNENETRITEHMDFGLKTHDDKQMAILAELDAATQTPDMTLDNWIATVTGDAVEVSMMYNKYDKMSDRKQIKEYDTTWEDTGRSKNSSGGKNIKDFTLSSAGGQRCKILRAPNYTDHSADVTIDKFSVVVGNEFDTPQGEGGDRKTEVIPFKEFVENIQRYCPDLNIKGATLLRERDTHLLTVPQSGVLPAREGMF